MDKQRMIKLAGLLNEYNDVSVERKIDLLHTHFDKLKSQNGDLPDPLFKLLEEIISTIAEMNWELKDKEFW